MFIFKIHIALCGLQTKYNHFLPNNFLRVKPWTCCSSTLCGNIVERNNIYEGVLERYLIYSFSYFKINLQVKQISRGVCINEFNPLAIWRIPWAALFFDFRPVACTERQCNKQPEESSLGHVLVLEPSWMWHILIPFHSASGLVRDLNSCFFPVLRIPPSALKVLSFRASICHRMTKSYFPSPEQSGMCSYRWSEQIPHICNLDAVSLLCCQDWFLNSSFWFLKGSWHCLCPFGLAGFAPTTSVSMITFIYLASLGPDTLE